MHKRPSECTLQKTNAALNGIKSFFEIRDKFAFQQSLQSPCKVGDIQLFNDPEIIFKVWHTMNFIIYVLAKQTESPVWNPVNDRCTRRVTRTDQWLWAVNVFFFLCITLCHSLASIESAWCFPTLFPRYVAILCANIWWVYIESLRKLGTTCEIRQYPDDLDWGIISKLNYLRKHHLTRDVHRFNL